MYIIAKNAITIIVNIGKIFTDNWIWIKKIGENRQMTDKQIIDEMIEKIGFDVQQCGYLKIIKDALNYPEIGGTFTSFECNLYSKDCDFIECCRYKQLLRKEQELKNICKEFDIEYLIDKETGNLICRCNKLNKKEQECEELKRKYNENLTVQKQLQEWQDEDLRQIKDLKQTIQQLNESIQTSNVERTKLYRKLSKIEEFCKELMSENEEYISINQVLQIIRGEE